MRKGLLGGALTLMLAGLFLPRAWYDNLPRNETLPPPPISGVTLLQICFVVEGLILLWLSVRSRSAGLSAEARRIALPAERERQESINQRAALALLGAITLFGLVLRLFHLDSDLWLDEIGALVVYRQMSPLQVMATYLGSSNHLLNTLLLKLSVASFGEHEWSVRLPAVVFGAATIPVFYWTARLVFTRLNSLGAALLLSVSYHHIFFSQNGRGYSAYVFFSLLSSTLFCKALGDGRLRTWALYVVTMSLNFASLLISAFVFASHVVVSLGVLVMWRRAGDSLGGAVRLLTAVFAVTGFLTFQLYALVLPQVYVYMTSVYTQAVAGYSLVSSEFLMELLRGLLVSVGARAGWGILPLLVIPLGLGAVAFVRLFQRHPVLIASLTLPEVLTAAAVLFGGLTVSPRFFLLALPLAILVFVEILDTLIRGVWRRVAPERRRAAAPHWPTCATTALISGLLLLPLLDYYKIPKQAYRASAEFLQRERRPDDLVVVVHLAEMGFRYYGPRFGLEESNHCLYLRSEPALASVMRAQTRGRILLVTTFPRALRLEHPNLASLVEQGWRVARVFAGTIGDGDITIWTPR